MSGSARPTGPVNGGWGHSSSTACTGTCTFLVVADACASHYSRWYCARHESATRCPGVSTDHKISRFREPRAGPHSTIAAGESSARMSATLTSANSDPPRALATARVPSAVARW